MVWKSIVFIILFDDQIIPSLVHESLLFTLALCSFGTVLLVFDSFLSFWWQLNVPDSFCTFFISEFILLLLHCNMVLFLQGALKHFNGELHLEMITQEFGVFITIWLSMFQFGFSGRAKKMCIIYICIYMCVYVYLKPMLILNI